MPKRPNQDRNQAGELDEIDTPVQEGERLQRVLASRGIASRRASEDMIKAGRIAVNGTVVTEMGTRVDPVYDEIRVDGKTLRRQKPRYIILNKPSGFITTVNDERQRWTVMDLVDVQERVYPVGRLDRDTQGLLLLTNDGNLANRVMHPRYGLTKEYHVITKVRPAAEQLQDIKDGLLIAGRLVVPDDCRILRETGEGVIIQVILHEGIYHVVRRMMEAVGIDVVRLRRVRLGPLVLQGIPSGGWRDLSPGELIQLYEAVGLPIEDAERANRARPIQATPVGGFKHGARSSIGGSEFTESPSEVSAAVPSARPEDAPSQGRGRDREQWKREGQGERTRRPPRRDATSSDSSSTRRPHDGPGSPVGNRNRRTGGRG
ncbi:MAG: pseudouridine synthase [Thermomicrobiales bacterium]